MARELVSSPVLSWTEVMSVIRAERVGPLLYDLSRRADLLPTEVYSQCEDAYLRSGSENVLRLEELSRIIVVLHAAGIDVVTLKGSALVEQLYGNIALRPMVDVDLLVRRNHVEEAVRILKTLRYYPASPELAPNSTLAFENELVLLKHGRLRWPLELHWNLFDSPFYQERIPAADLWLTSEPVTVNGVKTMALGTEHQLLHLCGHLALHHQGAGMLWWHDIALLLDARGKDLDWDLLLHEAQDYALVHALQVGLQTAAYDWKAPVPGDVLSRVSQMRPAPAEQAVVGRLASAHRPPSRRLIDDVAGIGEWRDRLAFLKHNLFPSGAYMDSRYNIPLSVVRPLYYPYRWARGLAGLTQQEEED